MFESLPVRMSQVFGKIINTQTHFLLGILKILTTVLLKIQAF
jgi:hypothetical protein